MFGGLCVENVWLQSLSKRLLKCRSFHMKAGILSGPVFFISIFVIAEVEKNLFHCHLCSKDTTAHPGLANLGAFSITFSLFFWETNLQKPSVCREGKDFHGIEGATERNFCILP